MKYLTFRLRLGSALPAIVHSIFVVHLIKIERYNSAGNSPNAALRYLLSIAKAAPNARHTW